MKYAGPHREPVNSSDTSSQTPKDQRTETVGETTIVGEIDIAGGEEAGQEEEDFSFDDVLDE